MKLIFKIEKFSFHEESFKKQRLVNFSKTFSFKRIHENLIIFKLQMHRVVQFFYALSFGV